MAKQKLTEVELKVKHYIPQTIDYSYQNSVSYSQFSTYSTCPHQWYLTSVEKKSYVASIHTVFGTAMHETLQEYLNMMYNESGAAADKMDLELIFEEKFKAEYVKEYEKVGKVHFTNAVEMREFFDDGITIIKWIRARRNKLFTIRKVKLLGIEMPLIVELKKNIYLKGYIDFVLYDTELNKVYIYDIKTSTRGWKDKEKKDEKKIAQILLYKEYFSKQYGIDVDIIEVEYFIVKRKIWEESEYPIPRVQNFRPPSGKNKRNQADERFRNFIEDCFDELGKPIKKSYLKNVGESSCKWCPYLNKPELCDKKN